MCPSVWGDYYSGLWKKIKIKDLDTVLADPLGALHILPAFYQWLCPAVPAFLCLGTSPKPQNAICPLCTVWGKQWDLIDPAVGGWGEGGINAQPRRDIENYSFKQNYKPEQGLDGRKNIAFQAVQDPGAHSIQKVPSNMGGTLWIKVYYMSCFKNCHLLHGMQFDFF